MNRPGFDGPLWCLVFSCRIGLRLRNAQPTTPRAPGDARLAQHSANPRLVSGDRNVVSGVNQQFRGATRPDLPRFTGSVRTYSSGQAIAATPEWDVWLPADFGEATSRDQEWRSTMAGKTEQVEGKANEASEPDRQQGS